MDEGECNLGRRGWKVSCFHTMFTPRDIQIALLRKKKKAMLDIFLLPSRCNIHFSPPYPYREPDSLLASGWAQSMGTTRRRLEVISPALSPMSDHALAVCHCWRSEHLPGACTSPCPIRPGALTALVVQGNCTLPVVSQHLSLLGTTARTQTD